MKCSKITFHTREEARKYIIYSCARGVRRKELRKMKPYSCGYCGLWHLTSRTKTKQRVINRIVKRQYKIRSMMVEFKSLANNDDKWNWLIENQCAWIELSIFDKTFLEFSGINGRFYFD